MAGIRCPALFVLAAEGLPGLPGSAGALMPALRAGIRRDLLPLTTDRPHLHVLELAAGHRMVAELPEQVARAVRGLRTQGAQAGRTGSAG